MKQNGKKVNAYQVNFAPNSERPNGTEVSVLALDKEQAVQKALEHLTEPYDKWTVEQVIEL